MQSNLTVCETSERKIYSPAVLSNISSPAAVSRCFTNNNLFLLSSEGMKQISGCSPQFLLFMH